MAHWPPEASEVAALRRVFDPRVARADSDACWVWLGAKTKGGYGHINLGTPPREFLVHRLALFFADVPLSKEQLALHSCDNPPCCNPKHLRAGTTLDNARDRTIRRRRIYELGEDNPSSRLRAEDVRRIRELVASGHRYGPLAREYNIAETTVGSIVRRVTWSHL